VFGRRGKDLAVGLAFAIGAVGSELVQRERRFDA
jgi:hypothetical protein